MDDTSYWADDTYWTEAIETLERLRGVGCTTLTLDLTAIEAVAYHGDGPAYKLMNAMVSVQEHEGWDGYRGAPRVMLALLVRLAEVSKTLEAKRATKPPRRKG